MVAMLIAIVLISPFVAVIIALTVIAAIFCAHGQKRARSAASSSTSSSGSMPVESEHGEERDDAFMANVRTHMRARIEETTRAGYDGALKRVAQWLVEDGHPELVDESGVIRYVTITREIQVLQVLSTLDKHLRDGKNVPRTFSTWDGYSSALSHGFRVAKVPRPAIWKDSFSETGSGMKKTQAKERKVGSRAEVGKKAMSVACYTELCEIMMKLTDDRFVESQAFLKLQFTVIGRSNTTASVNWKNTKIEGDHLSTFHSNNKKDQAGTDKSTKACYANPFDPCTCLFTALGIYVLCNPDLHEHFIFPPTVTGQNTAEKKFSDALAAFLKLDEVVVCLERHGFEASDIQTHSVRKTGASFGAAQEHVSIMTICLRAAWTITQVMKKYIFRERGADNQLGRTMALIPGNTAEFNALPPHFAPSEEARAQRMIAENFPNVHEPQRKVVLKMLVASVIHHSAWLKDNLPSDHPLFQTHLFRDGADLDYFTAETDEPRMFSGLMKSPCMTATGTTNTSTLMGEVAKLRSEVSAIRKHQEETEPRLEGYVMNAVEKAALKSGQVTMQQLTNVLRSELDSRGFTGRGNEQGGEGGNGGVGSGDSPDGFRLFTWGGKLRRAPLNYMPRWRANFRIACGLWFQGVKSLGVRPLCDVPACDLGGGLDIAARRTATKPYSDWKYTFKELRRHAAADDDCEFTALFTSASKWGDVASVVDVQEFYDWAIKKVVDLRGKPMKISTTVMTMGGYLRAIKLRSSAKRAKTGSNHI